MEQTDNYRKHTSQNPLQKFLIKNFYKSLINSIRNLDIESILDVGCGEGFTLNRLYEEGIGKRLEGVDFLEAAIDLGKKIHPHLKLRQGNIYNLQFEANFFDLVMATEVLEHLEYPRKGLRELVRVSKKYILLSVPNEPFFMIANFLRGKNITRWGNDIEHIQHWSAWGFKKFGESEKLKVISAHHPFPWTLILLEK